MAITKRTSGLSGMSKWNDNVKSGYGNFKIKRTQNSRSPYRMDDSPYKRLNKRSRGDGVDLAYGSRHGMRRNRVGIFGTKTDREISRSSYDRLSMPYRLMNRKDRKEYRRNLKNLTASGVTGYDHWKELQGPNLIQRIRNIGRRKRGF